MLPTSTNACAPALRGIGSRRTSARFDYDSVVPGYGAGGYDYIRLTQLEGTAC